jgi:hypothetical protein
MSFITQFLSKGVITSLVGMITLILSNTGHNAVAIWLSDPDNMNQIFMIIGAILTLLGGALPGVKQAVAKSDIGSLTPTNLPSSLTEEIQKNGYVWDSLKGWVKKGG